MRQVRSPGLDLSTLARYRTPRHDTTAMIDRIAAHLDEHDGYVAFSGGKDSTVVLDLARRADPHVPVCFFDSGLEFPETLEYIMSLTDTWQLNLHTVPAQPSALEYLQATGAWDHHAPTRNTLLRGNGFHHALITAPAAAAHADHGAGELWGIRAHEAPGRRVLLLRGLAQEITQHCPTGCCPRPADGTLTDTASGTAASPDARTGPSRTAQCGTGSTPRSTPTYIAAASRSTRCTTGWPNSAHQPNCNE